MFGLRLKGSITCSHHSYLAAKQSLSRNCTTGHYQNQALHGELSFLQIQHAAGLGRVQCTQFTLHSLRELVSVFFASLQLVQRSACRLT